MKTLLVFPALCRSSGPGCATYPHPTCPRLGEQPRDAGDQLRPGQVGFAPVGSYSLGAPLAESSAPHLAATLLGFGTLCLAVSPFLGLPIHPIPTQPLLELPAAGSSRDGDGGTLRRAREQQQHLPLGSSEPLAVVQEQRASSCCGLINLCHISELAVCGQEAQRGLVGFPPSLGGCRGMAPLHLLRCGPRGVWFWERRSCCSYRLWCLPLWPSFSPLRHPQAPQNLTAGSDSTTSCCWLWL